MLLLDWSSINLFLVGISAAVSFILGFVVLLSGRKNATNRAFFYFSLINSFWGVINYFQYQSINPVVVLWSLRLVMFSAVWQAYTFFQLAYIYPKEKIILPKWITLGALPATGIISLLTLSPLVFSDIRTPIIAGKISEAIPGPGIPFFGIIAVGLVALGIFLLIKKFRGASEQLLKTQLRLFLLGTTIMFSLIIMGNFILPILFKNLTFIQLGAAFTIPFVGILSFTILKHHLFNVRVILTGLFAIIINLVFLGYTLFSGSTPMFLLNVITLCLLMLFSILLVRGTIREMNELEELSKAKSEFVSIASHQLRTPLTAIKGYISLMLEGTYGGVPETQRETLGKVYTSNERLIHLVNDLLDLSRIEQGKWQYNLAKVAVGPMIQSVIGELKIAAQSKNLLLHFQKPSNAEKFLAWADEEKLRQSVLNLVDNAIKYTEKGEIEVRLEVDINPTLMRLSVKDTGMGLSIDDKSRIFQRFSRGKDSFKMNTGGTGLGLFVAKKIVEDHGGRIFAESPGLGKGSTFIILVPFYRKKKSFNV